MLVALLLQPEILVDCRLALGNNFWREVLGLLL